MKFSVIPRRGFTLLELLVTLLILSIILGAGVPMMLGLAKSMRLQGAAQDTYALLQYARSDALRTTEDRFVVWDESATQWCAAVATTNDCDCLTEDCSINGVLRQINSSDYTNVDANAVFAAGDYTRFDGMRGLAEGHAGTARYQLMDDATVEAEVRVVVSVLGRIRYCKQSGEIGDYPAC
ncbi:GspH/FimT family pseudopilin [Pseudidiomarina terrestris]|uniref:Type II secretion system protein H n=1 Tax=Pseudidiomarina terrestris TaxID=2820060 RepID=A0AAW7R0Z9_9GAMM|nr:MULTISPECIES: GspH/FimT family protein [unclassified Pseudidiomarina]MDN7124607.1 GspH/FimT family protein [Pseudidiomarina sp. 1APP75-32.1]MDN7126847.1 GspH/FimT family protein [Pseudidiomarina sp. 1APR75-33.1]MDN7129102.1 GspH/FimT family protein [Pseudidiomarina sp. 1APR75-15]MDN7134634.1 GspH/FimT family protein [Pseudidiomarina sp. 1ASP75-5]MEA3587578.1 GspH/FimT family protein [Pseudidiomarina sp. 1APP75-27a]